MTQSQQLIFMIRPKAASIETVNALAVRLGRIPKHVLCPLIEIRALDIDLPTNMNEPFVFTSSNAVEIAIKRTKQRGRVLCVGQKVANCAKRWGFDVIRTFDTANELIAHGLPDSFTYLQGERASVDLQPYGADSYVLYEQVPVELEESTLKQMKNGGVVPVYSENAAKFLMSALSGEKTNMAAICISEKVAKRLDSLAFQRILVAESPTSIAMLDRIIEEI